MSTHSATVRGWTYEEFDRLPDDGNRYEVIAGDLYVTPAPGSIHQAVSARLVRLFGNFCEEQDAGIAFHAPYDVILGSDILYAERGHEHLRRIFAANLAPGGRVLLSDPFRAKSLPLLDALEGEGWWIALSKWTVGEDESPRPIGVYELAR